MDSILRDIRHAVRTLAGQRAFTLTALTTGGFRLLRSSRSRCGAGHSPWAAERQETE